MDQHQAPSHLERKIAYIFFIFISGWWLYLFFNHITNSTPAYLFAATYGIMALLGGIWGLEISRKWGGTKSVMGKAITSMAFGLLAAEFGQIVFSFYNIFQNNQVPYPSLADIGFFANIPLYSIGILYLARASGVRFTAQKLSHKIQIVLLPIAMLYLSYYMFLQKYEFDWGQPLKIFLDFGYPFGQAIYVSLALLTYSLSKRVLGVIIKKIILFILFAFLMQYVADYNFLFQSSRGTWANGGYGDFLYFLAYFLMTLGLLNLQNIQQS